MMIIYTKLDSKISLQQPIEGLYEVALLETYSNVGPGKGGGASKKYLAIYTDFTDYIHTDNANFEPLLAVIPCERMYHTIVNPTYIPVLRKKIYEMSFTVKSLFTKEELAHVNGKIIIKLHFRQLSYKQEICNVQLNNYE